MSSTPRPFTILGSPRLPVPAIYGGTGQSVYAVGDILYADTTTTLAKLPAGTSGKLLSTQGPGAAPIWVAATGGAGDMNGPASATDNAIARFDGTGGKTLQNSTALVNDDGSLTINGTTLFSVATDAEAVTGTSTSKVPSVASMRAGVAPLRNAMGTAQALSFDGTSAAVVSVLNQPVLGTGDFSVRVKLLARVISSSPCVVHNADTNAPCFRLLADGSFRVGPGDAGGTYTAAAAAGSFAINQTADFVWTRASGLSRLYKDGVLVAGPTADATNYSTAIGKIGSSSGASTVFDGIVYAFNTENRALSAAEVLALYESGAPAAADYNSASNTSLVSGADSNFSSAGSWTVSGATTISGGKLNLSSDDFANNNLVPLTLGKRVKFTITVDSITAGGVNYFDGSSYVQFATAAGTYTVEFTAVASYSGFYVKTVGGNAVCDNFLAYNVGLLCAPESNAPGNGLVWNDQSGNGAHIVLPTSGVAWNLPSNAPNRVRGTTNTNGNVLLLGAASIVGNTQILRVRARARSGTPTITLGTNSGGSEIVASVGLTTSWKILAVALTAPVATTGIWAGSNSTDVIEWDVSHEPLAF